MRDRTMAVPNHADWPEEPLQNLCLAISRGTAPTYVETSPILAIGQRCVRLSGFDASAARPHDRRFRSVLWAVPGDVLLNSTGTGTIGRSCVFDQSGKFMVDSHVTVLRGDRSKIDPRWVEALLRSQWGQRHLESHCYTGSTNQIELSRSELVQTAIPVPPIHEQRRIVEIFNALDSRVSAVDAIIEKLHARNHGLVEGLVACVVGERESLGSYLVHSPKNGFSPKEVDEWTGVQALGLGCLTSDGFDPRQLKNVPAQDVRNKAALLKDGDLLISRANTRELVGLVGVYREIGTPCIYPDLMMRLTVASHCRPAYMELLLRANDIRRQVQAIAQGTSESMVKISGSSVQQLKLAIPPLAEQGRILDIVAAAENEIEVYKRERSKLTLLKEGVTEDLLTGRVRVPEAEAVLRNR